MFLFIAGLVVTGALFFVLGLESVELVDNYGRKYNDVKWHLNLKKQVFALAGLLICLLGCVTRVPANNVGIVYSPFGGTREQTLNEGTHIKNVFDKVYDMSTEVQTLKIEGVTTQTKDAQYVSSNLDVKYRVNPSNAYIVFKQYRKLNVVSDTLIAPTTQRVLELVTTKYNVIDILGEKRNSVYSELESSLTEEFAKYGIEFYSISISDMDAGAAIEAAIEQEAVAKKAVETAEQNLLKTEAEAKQKSVKAKADQEAAKIEAETRLIEAEAEKKANDLLTQSLTDQVLKKEWIDKWDGKMPTYYAGEGDGNLMIGVE